VIHKKIQDAGQTINVLNCGPHHVMRPQYCGCGPQRNRIGPQLRCDRKSHATPQRIRNATPFFRNATPQQTAIVNSVTNQGKSIKKKLKKNIEKGILL
jgi:hypothetical protein